MMSIVTIAIIATNGVPNAAMNAGNSGAITIDVAGSAGTTGIVDITGATEITGAMSVAGTTGVAMTIGATTGVGIIATKIADC